MKIAFYGGQTAGIISLLALLTSNKSVNYVFPEDENIQNVSHSLGLKTLSKSLINKEKTIKLLYKNTDYLICCHGKKILSEKFVNTIKCINIHPCLYMYKGADPIGRLIKEKNPKASVASHWMSEKIDAGKVIYEEYKKIPNIETSTPAMVYSALYSTYISVLLKTIALIRS